MAGVDDDANGIVDDVGETGWAGSDDGDDTQRQIRWMCMKANVETTSVIYLCMDGGSIAEGFAIWEFAGGPVNNYVELSDEIISFQYFQPNIKYNWVFCVAGHSCYGAQLWQTTDMANPAETVGPVISTSHTAPGDNIVAMAFDTGSGGSGTPVHFKRQMMFQGNDNFADKFWVLSGPSDTYYPSPSSDLDLDKDVDGFDFLTFSNCYNGSNRTPLAACASVQADLDQDGDVDGFDFLTFSNCYNGSNRRPLAACFPPNLTTCAS